MWSTLLLPLLILLTLVPYAYAHGRITNITTSNGRVYKGWDAEYVNEPPLPKLAAWSAENLGNIFVPPLLFNTSQLACHIDAKPGALHVNTTAGSTVKLQWNEWPTSHVGPVLTYLAACNGSCTNAHKESLQWVKIDELGWLNSTGWEDLGLGGTWASNVLIANDFQWTVKIPEVLAEGNYVLRHEIIALHIADQFNGAQAYPQCVNLRVGASKKVQNSKRKNLLRGVVGSALYGSRDKGILVDVHKKIEGYEIPGPRVWSEASRYVQPNELS